MPYCEACAKFWNPSTMTAEGACPSCGRVLDATTAGAPRFDAKTLDVKALAGEERTPWHFKLLVVAVVAYLAWRFVELIVWVL